MDLGVYPETKAGGSLLGLLPLLSLRPILPGRAEPSRTRMDFLLQAACLPKPTRRAQSPAGVRCSGATSSHCLLAGVDLPDLGAGYCLLVFCKKGPFFLFKIKYLAVISALPPLSLPVNP